jgi:hypothetical protein
VQLSGVAAPLLPRSSREVGDVNPLFSFTPESLDALVEQVANRAAEKVRDDLWPKWMDAATAARYTSLTEKAITNRCRDGRIVARKVSDGWRMNRGELDRYMEDGRP